MKRAFPLLFIFLLLSSLPPLSYSGEKGFETAEICKKCHGVIYDQWKSSRHSNSFTEPNFGKVYRATQSTSPDRASLCRFCHNPIATIPKGYKKEGITEGEGITCDFCHTVKEVTIGNDFPRFVNTPGTKRGPIADARSPYHETEFSPLLLDSKFCAGCHEFTNENGVPVLTTYSEWEQSFYRGEGIHCQFCHLPQLFPGSDEEGPPDHTMQGGYYPEKIREAITMTGTLRFRKKEAILEIELFNDRSGHKVPTGIPTHRLIVNARLNGDRGEVIGEKQVFIERVLGNREGKPISSAADMFLNASTVLKDNRIGPKEKRMLTLEFPLEKGSETLSAAVSLLYEIPSPDPVLKTVKINIDDMTIHRSGMKFPFQALILGLILITACLLAYDIFIRLKIRRKE